MSIKGKHKITLAPESLIHTRLLNCDDQLIPRNSGPIRISSLFENDGVTFADVLHFYCLVNHKRSLYACVEKEKHCTEKI